MDGTIRTRQALCAVVLWAGALLATPVAAAPRDETSTVRSLSVTAVVLARCEFSRPDAAAPPRVDCGRSASAHRILLDAPNPDDAAPARDTVDPAVTIVEVNF